MFLNIFVKKSQVLITDTDLHAVVSVCAIIFLIVAAIGVVGRVFTKLAVVKSLAVDDYVAFLALILYAAQSAFTLTAAGNGLGRHWETLTLNEQHKFEETIYASGILFITCVVAIKLSIVLFVRGLTPISIHRRVGFIIGIGLLTWAVSSILAAIFQCQLPRTWQVVNGTCFDRLAFWNSFNALDIVTDAVLVLWPSLIVSQLHTSLSRRCTIIFCFACRLCTIAAALAQLILANRAAKTSDFSFNTWPVILCAQAVQCLSITTACIPYLRPFLDSLESGLLRSDDSRRRGQGGAYGYGTSKSSRKGSSSTRKAAHSDSIPLDAWSSAEHDISCKPNSTRAEDAQSTSSQTRIIKYSTSWTVSNEPRTLEIGSQT